MTTLPPTSSPTSGDYGYLRYFLDGDNNRIPFRWDPCNPIRYAVDVGNAESDTIAAMNRAIARTEQATALDFQYVGPTTADVSTGPPTVPAFADVVFVLTTVAESFDLTDQGEVGRAESSSVFPPGQRVSGYVLAAREEPAFEAIFMHELGHLLGLQHVGDDTELMFPYSFDLTQPVFGPGDLEGLWNVGASRPCF